MNYPELERLIGVVQKLRDPNGGCPWDLEQTNQSLLRFLIEETYEYIYAVENGDIENMQEELGDVLLQVVLHATIAKQDGHFDIEKVSKGIADKLIFRHPHVFQKDRSQDKITSDQVLKNWDELKKIEKKDQQENSSQIDSGLLGFPSLYSAYKIGKKTSKIKFDWNNDLEVLAKVEEEIAELKEQLKKQNRSKDKINEELGDVFFSLAQLARHLKIEPEQCARDGNKKFLNRFHLMESIMRKSDVDFGDLDQTQLDIYWEKAKKLEQ